MRTLTVPATSANLGPGFDCLGLALSCYNTIEFEFIESGLHIELEPRDLFHIPADSRNLIYRVFCGVLKTYGITPPGVHFAQVNEIPAMSGLGSSAASVVGGVVMADTYMGFKMTKQEMLDICASQEGHPDNILPALLGGLTVGCMDNGHVRYLRMDAPKSLRLAVFIPPFSLSTRKARSVLPKTVPLEDAVFNLTRAALLTAALATGELSALPFAVNDRLHQPYRKSLVPGYDDIARLADASGALATYLSGAGPTLISFFDKSPSLESLTDKLESLHKGWQVRLLCVDSLGYRLK